MAKIASIILLVLTVAAISAPTDAAGVGGIAASFAKVLAKWKKPIGTSMDIFQQTIIEFATMDDMDDCVLPRRGNDAAAEMVTVLGVAATIVQAGGTSFPVAGVDVTSNVSWTSRCGGGGEAVPCGEPLCEQHGKIALLGTQGQTMFSKDNAAYACRPNAAAATAGDYAVIGLGRGNAILPDASPLFSYIIDSDLQGSTVWVGIHARSTERAAARAGRRWTTGLDTASSFYYVGIAGIKVGSGEVGGGVEPAALGIMTTTIPFTFLKPAIFNHLEQELSAVASPVSASSNGSTGFGQLCYPSGTELPAITLVFDGKDAGMELRPEHYSYKMSSGAVCLSILPSPWTSSGLSLSVIGSMVQADRRMTYKLDDNTLTFDAAASSAPSNPSPSPSLSSSSVAQAKLTPFFLFVVMLLAIIM
ncbi:unnamed protein product [Urochloa humidicola]